MIRVSTERDGSRCLSQRRERRLLGLRRVRREVVIRRCAGRVVREVVVRVRRVVRRVVPLEVVRFDVGRFGENVRFDVGRFVRERFGVVRRVVVLRVVLLRVVVLREVVRPLVLERLVVRLLVDFFWEEPRLRALALRLPATFRPPAGICQPAASLLPGSLPRATQERTVDSGMRRRDAI